MINAEFSMTISGVTRATLAHGSALDIAQKAAHLLRPWTVKAIHIDAVNRVVYAAVERPEGYTFAAISEYRWDKGVSCGVHMDFDCDETQGPTRAMQSCGLNVLEKLSPLSDFPDVCGDAEYSKERRQRAKDWRQTCLRKIIRSRKSSDEEQATAHELLSAIKQPI